MSKLNERLTLIANLSVVVGIVFLAVEVQQNTQALRAQTRDAITEKQMEYIGWVATAPELSETVAKVDSLGLETLSRREFVQWSSLQNGELREWENSFYQFENGLFTPEEFEARRERWRRQLTQETPRGAAVRSLWDNVRDMFAPSFRAEIDRIVAEVEQAQ